MQVTVNVKEDKRDSLSSAFEKRMSLLEKVLIDLKRNGKKDTDSIIKSLEKNREKEVKMVSKLTESLSSALKKVGSPKVEITQKDNSSELAKSINKRISMLEDFLKKNKRKDVVKEVKTVKRIVNNYTVNNVKGGRVVPSPS